MLSKNQPLICVNVKFYFVSSLQATVYEMGLSRKHAKMLPMRAYRDADDAAPKNFAMFDNMNANSMFERMRDSEFRRLASIRQHALDE